MATNEPTARRSIDGFMVADSMSDAPRIAVLDASLADQIAAGEVIDRPASIVKELVENAIDANASRIDIELTGGGIERVRVLDDGHGIHPDDLVLAVTRHATSKVRKPADLIELTSLGFRGEALASIAAVAELDVRSRTAAAKVGTRLHSRPGLPLRLEPVGMSIGTDIDVVGLFRTVPARRKFLRAEATEVSHCNDTVLRLALVQPTVRLRLRHGGRTLFDFKAGSLADRVTDVLTRKAAGDPMHVSGVHEGIRVEGWFLPASAHLRGTQGLFIVVRRRIVRDRNLARIAASMFESLPSGHYPIACLLVDPPPGTVDVNVHPQKNEVRFSDPQRVYAALRSVLGGLRAAAVPSSAEGLWFGVGAPPSPPQGPRFGLDLPVLPPLAGHSAEPTAVSGAHEEPPAGQTAQDADDRPPGTVGGYRLRTRATEPGYVEVRRALQSQAQQLGERLAGARSLVASFAAEQSRATTGVEKKTEPTASLAAAAADSPRPQLELLTCLPGPVALARWNNELVAVDLARLRNHLVFLRLQAELGGSGIHSQALLRPVVIRCAPQDVAVFAEQLGEVVRLGIVGEPFGDDAILIRAVPAHLRSCSDEPSIHALLQRILPWLRMHDRASGVADVLHALADASGEPASSEPASSEPASSEPASSQPASTRSDPTSDPAPRLARRWLRELLELSPQLDDVPGVRRWSAHALLERKRS